MAAYGDTAVRAVNLYTSGKASSIVDAWEIAARENFHTDPTRKKGCPRATFLGICEGGHIAGVPAGEYNTRLSDNKRYGLIAISILRQNPLLAEYQILLWKKIGNENLKPNGQMDVVTALWRENLIKCT